MTIETADKAVQHLYDAFAGSTYTSTKSWTIAKKFTLHPICDQQEELFHQDLSLVKPKSKFKQDCLVPPDGIEPPFPAS